MKRCRTCNRTYTDPNLSYCIDDGTPLTTEVPADESSVVSPSSSTDGSSRSDDWNPASYRPPGAYLPQATTGKRRRAWPWVVGIVGGFVLGMIGLTIAAAIFVPRWMRSRQFEPPIVVTSNDNTPEPPQPETEVNTTPAPTNEDQVLAQLTDLENEWTVANLNADKQKLQQILADDYVGQSAEGGLQGKAEYINTIQRDTRVERWEFDDLKVHLSGTHATLTGKITYFANGRELAFDFTDKFVWRNGRWQATGSEIKPRE